LGNYIYTIATGSFGIKAFKTKIVLLQISNLTQPIHKSYDFRKSKTSVSNAFHTQKAKVSQAFRKGKLANVFSGSKSKFKGMFKKVRIPNSLKNYFSRLTKR